MPESMIEESLKNADMVIPVVCYGSCFTCDYEIPEVNVTFQVDMSEVDSISADGVFVAGGLLGQDGHQLFDTDGDSIYTVTIPLVPGSEHTYKFRNAKTIDYPTSTIAQTYITYIHIIIYKSTMS